MRFEMGYMRSPQTTPTPRSYALQMLGSLAIFVVQGCAGQLGSSQPTEAPRPPIVVPESAPAPVAAPQSAPAPAKAYHCAKVRAPSQGPPPPVTLEALQRAVESPDVATSAAILGQLADLRFFDGTRRAGVFERNYPTLGLRIGLTGTVDKMIIKRVELRSDDFSTWAGSLPEELSFAMNAKDTLGALGQPDANSVQETEPAHHYQARGLFVRFDRDDCLLGVGFTLRIPHRTIRFDDFEMIVDEDRDLTGITVRVTQKLGDFGSPTAVTLRLELRDEKGRPVPSLDARGRDAGMLRVEEKESEDKEEDLKSNERRRELFVPYAAMRLSPGPQALRAELSARAKGKKGASVPIEVVGSKEFPIAFEMPPLRRARIGVRRVEVTKVDILRGEGNQLPFVAPDLYWSLLREVRNSEVNYDSAVRQDTYTASWSGLAPWIVVAPKDLIDLCIVDKDFMSSEVLHCVGRTLDQLIDAAKQKQPIEDGRIKSMLLIPPVVSPMTLR